MHKFDYTHKDITNFYEMCTFKDKGFTINLKYLIGNIHSGVILLQV